MPTGRPKRRSRSSGIAGRHRPEQPVAIAGIRAAEREALMHYEASDPHLNLFRRFGLPPGTQEYENNVTHALINTLRLSDPRVARIILSELAPEVQQIPIDWSDI